MAAITMIPPAAAPDFLARNGWGGARIEPLAGDASFRRYFRIVQADRTAVLMDAPPPHEDPRPFAAVADWLLAAGLTPPPILARDLDQGMLLLGDFGDARLRETLDAAPQREEELYALATDVLIHLHRQPPMVGLKPHGLDQWLSELTLFTDWYCPAVGIAVDADAWRAAWSEVLTPIANDGLGPVTVLRDYHAENIMLLAGRQGIGHFGLLDFQDALAGHRAYDLVSLLQDARRDVSPELEAAMIDRYLATAGIADRDTFLADYAVIGAQRHAKVLGIFTRLWKRDGKPHYLAFQPRNWGMMERCLAHPALSGVRAWFDANVPAAARATAFADHAE